MEKKILNYAYEWLNEHAYGKENGKSLWEVAYAILPTPDRRLMRKIISEINSSNDYGLISTSGKIYLCRTEEECEKAIRTSYRLALSCLKKAKKMNNKLNRHGQFELTDDNGKKIRIVYED